MLRKSREKRFARKITRINRTPADNSSEYGPISIFFISREREREGETWQRPRFKAGFCFVRLISYVSPKETKTARLYSSSSQGRIDVLADRTMAVFPGKKKKKKQKQHTLEISNLCRVVFTSRSPRSGRSIIVARIDSILFACRLYYC